MGVKLFYLRGNWKTKLSYEVANQTFKSTSSSVMGLNEWIHLVGVRESTHTKLFMNGSLVSQNVGSSGSVNETGRNLYFGKYRDSNSIFSNISILLSSLQLQMP